MNKNRHIQEQPQQTQSHKQGIGVDEIHNSTSDYSCASAVLNDNRFASGLLSRLVVVALRRLTFNHCFLLFQINVIEAKKKTDILMAVSSY